MSKYVYCKVWSCTASFAPDRQSLDCRSPNNKDLVAGKPSESTPRVERTKHSVVQVFKSFTKEKVPYHNDWMWCGDECKSTEMLSAKCTKHPK